MTINFARPRVWLGTCALALLACGHSAPDDAEGASGPSPEQAAESAEGAPDMSNLRMPDGSAIPADLQPGVYGELLYRVELEAGHSVDFYDFGDGNIGVRESFGPGQTSALSAVDQASTLPEIQQALEPGSPVPEVLIDGELRAREFEARRASEDAYAGEPTDQATLDGITEAFHRHVGKNSEFVQKASCSSDVYGDAWSAQWWVNNACEGKPGYTPARCNGKSQRCETNWGAYSCPNCKYDWQEFTFMEGDYNVAGSTQGWKRVCKLFSCWWDLAFWEGIQPRRTFSWWFRNYSVEIDARSPCAHLHLRVKWMTHCD